MHACFAKQLAKRDPRDKGQSWPRLWLICARTPRTVLRAYALERRLWAPSGFYDSRASGLRLSLIAVPELPLGRDTVLLRLLGRGRLLAAALRELRGLPADAVERELGYPAAARPRHREAQRKKKQVKTSTGRRINSVLNVRSGRGTRD